ncbi:TRAP-type C4-dicarboxylate transport system substrate-binding protein [Neobacillus niacini]|uniref:TRAP transporter substrate-binding protein n=1 Tax=Neobacillus niacini TaxID=86668 RepID=UPI00278B41D1|nr:TRAP transporter substrate-binding protein [Neobacillus niacini]MDQ1002183.1 TRAP-type C4-dicarboxylate transport system substrate-binding protein [Neobacillus niacini]
MVSNFKNRKVYLFAIFMLILIVISACGKNETTASGDTDTGSNDETFTLQMNSAFTASVTDWEPKYFAQERFAELVEERTDGKVKIEIFYTNQLSGQETAIDALAKGTFDIQNGNAAMWGDKIPEGLFLSLPYWNISEEQTFSTLYDTEVRELYSQALEEYNVKLLLNWTSGPSGFNSNKPLASVKDFEGTLINSVTNVSTSYFKHLGAGIASVPYSELYEAMSRGTIDAFTYPYSALETSNLHEVVDYVTIPPWQYGMGDIVMNLDTWNSLPKNLQDTISDVAKEMEQETRNASMETYKKAIDFANEHDVEVVKMDLDEYKKMRELAIESSWKDYSKFNKRTKKIYDILVEEGENYLNSEEGQEYLKQYLNK